MPYKDPDKQREFLRQWNQDKTGAIRNWLNQRKAAHGCFFCGEREPVALSFHHRDPSQKLFSIGSVNGRPRKLGAIEAEAEKCMVLCHNCHAKLHAGLLSL